jgi:hypothetical protein
MSDPGFAGWIAEHHVGESPAQQMARQARLAAERQDRAELAADAERAAAIEERADQRAVAFMTLGIAGRSQAEVFAEAGRVGDEDAEYAEAQKTIERIERRRASRVEAMRYQSEQLAMASRAAADDGDIYAQAQRRAHRAFAEHTRGLLSDAAGGAPRQERRPFARRSENCIHCIEQGATDEEAFLLHADPQTGIPVTPPGQDRPAEKAEHAERRTPSRRYAEISR